MKFLVPRPGPALPNTSRQLLPNLAFPQPASLPKRRRACLACSSKRQEQPGTDSARGPATSDDGGQVPGNFGNRFAAARSKQTAVETSTRSEVNAADVPDGGTLVAQLTEAAESLGGLSYPQLVAGASTAFYGSMTLAAIGLGEANGGHAYVFLMPSTC